MKKHTIGLAAALLASCCAFAAPLRLDDVPEDARWLVHLDMEKLSSSRLGAALFNPESMGERLRLVQEAAKQDAGIDLLKDVSGATLYSCSPEGGGVAVIRGSFKPEAVLAALKANRKASSESFNGKEIATLAAKRSGKSVAVCFLDGGTAVASTDVERLKAAIDVLEGKRPHLAEGGGELPLPENRAAILLFAMNKPQGVAGRLAKSERIKDANVKGSFCVSEEAGRVAAVMKLDAGSVELAGQAERTLRGFLALATLRSKSPLAVEIAKSAVLRTEGTRLSGNFEAPVEMIRPLAPGRP